MEPISCEFLDYKTTEDEDGLTFTLKVSDHLNFFAV